MYFWIIVFIDTVTVLTGDCNKETAMASKLGRFSSWSHFISLLGKLHWGKPINRLWTVGLMTGWKQKSQLPAAPVDSQCATWLCVQLRRVLKSLWRYSTNVSNISVDYIYFFFICPLSSFSSSSSSFLWLTRHGSVQVFKCPPSRIAQSGGNARPRKSNPVMGVGRVCGLALRLHVSWVPTQKLTIKSILFQISTTKNQMISE